MLTWLAELPRRLPPLPLSHVPHPRRGGDRAFPRLLLRSDDHLRAAAEAGQGAADPRRRAGLASSHQEGHADHGRPHDPVRPLRLGAAVGQSRKPVCVDRAVRHRGLRRDRLLRRLSEGDEAVGPRLLGPRAPVRRIRHRRARLLRADAGRRQWRDRARGAVRQRLRVRFRLGVPAVRPVRHRRLRQCGQSDRRSRRPRDRAGDDRRRDARAHRLYRRQLCSIRTIF